MEANIIKVGNSKGIIIPSKLIRLLGLHDRVKMAIRGNALILEPYEENPRSGWTQQFLKAGSKEDKALLIPEVFEDETLEDW